MLYIFEQGNRLTSPTGLQQTHLRAKQKLETISLQNGSQESYEKAYEEFKNTD